MASYKDCKDFDVELCDVSLSRLVNVYMMTSYAYYRLDLSLIEDYEYDYICKILHDNYEQITHSHKKYFNKDDLLSGTGFMIPSVCPEIVKAACEKWISSLENNNTNH